MDLFFSIVFIIVPFISIYSLIDEILVIIPNSLNNRDRVLSACLLQGGFLWIILQGLSIFEAITKTLLIIAWLFVIAICLCVTIWLKQKRRAPIIRVSRFAELINQYKSLPITSKIITGLISFLFVALAFIGFVYPSSFSDSMTYHLPRVMHWAQNRSVFPYATAILRQVQMPPFAEYQILNLYVLGSSDYLAAWVQIFSFFGCFIGVTNIAKRLGGTNTEQLLAGLFCLSLPNTILESTATQNDIAVAMWVVIFINFLLYWLHNKNHSWSWVLIGISLGFALFTKATAYVFLMPFCIWLMVSAIQNGRKTIKWGGVAVFLAIVINLPFFLWNMRVFNNPVGTTEKYFMREFSAKYFLSNIIRDFDAQSQLNLTRESYCSPLHNALTKLHSQLGISDSDPINTYYSPYPGFICQNFHLHSTESTSNNPIHYWLMSMSIVLLAIFGKRFSKTQITYFLLILSGYLVYHFLFRYQIFGTRLQNTFFILSSPLVIILSQAFSKKVTRFILYAMTLLAFTWVYSNQNRPLSISRISLSLENRTRASLPEDKYLNVEKITNKIIENQCSTIGLEWGSEVWEYPFWLSLSEKGWTGTIEHLYVRNSTNAFIPTGYVPCAIITNDIEKRAEIHHKYREFIDQPFSLLYLED